MFGELHKGEMRLFLLLLKHKSLAKLVNRVNEVQTKAQIKV